MATIKTSIALHDGMTSALQSINRAMNIVLNSFESMQRASSNSIDTKSIQTARNEIARASNSLNQIEREINENTTAQNKFNNSMKNASGHASNLLGKLKGIVATYAGFSAARGIINMADELTTTTARLNMMNDGLQTTIQLENKIYQSAMRSRAGYAETADIVAKLGLRAGSIFKNNDETIAFAETLNKMFVIAGASQAEMASASLQLTQALGAGTLRGEEFNAVFEAAPNIMQAVADYMNVPIGQLRNMAAEGQITADIVKNALFSATDKVNDQFAAMPYTWAQVWTTIKTYTLKATMPILKAISAITKNERFIAFATEVGNVIRVMARGIKNAFNALKPVIVWLYDTIAAIYNFFRNNWSLIAPIVWGIAGAFFYYKTALMAVWTWQKLCAITTGALTIAKVIGTFATQGITKATSAWAAAQLGLNGAMWACPITWIILAIVAVIAVIYIAVAALNKWAGTSISATGIVAGAFYVLGAYIWNTIAYIWNAIASFVEFFVNVWSEPMYSVKALFVNLATNVIDSAIAMTKGWDKFATNMVNAIVKAVNGVLSAWNWMVEKMGSIGEKLGLGKATMFESRTSITSDFEGWKSDLQGILGEKPKGYWEAPTMDYKVLGDSWDKGYNWGSNFADKVDSAFSGENVANTINEALDSTSGLNDIGKALSDALGSNPALDAIKGNTGDIAQNTSDIAASDEELSFMKDMAEREAINRYTLTTLKLNMTNNNSINNGMDADQLMERIQQQVYETAVSGANGSHF